MHTKQFQFYTKLISALALLNISQAVKASGFAIPVQNVTNLGTSYAGTAALAEDASTNYYNAAGLTKLNQEQLVVGGVLILPHTTLDVTRAVSTLGTVLSPSTGSTRPSNSAYVPSFHYAKRIDSQWIFGFSSVVPFGSKTNYKSDSIARYTSSRAELKTLNLGPSLAYQFNPEFSLGGGIDTLYALAKLDAKIGSGNLATDGFNAITASNWGIGYHIGGLYEINEGTRLGVQYHSKIKNKLKGTSLTQLAAGLTITSQGIKSEINFPEALVFSAYHAFDDKWAVMADVQGTKWNRFDKLILNYADGSQLIINENYKNAYRVAGGGSYQYNEQWRFKLGISYDRTPTRDSTRNIIIPDQDQIIPALGAQYRLNKNLALEFGYTHIFYKKAKNINETAPLAIGTTQGLQNIQGSTKNRIDAFGFQLTWDINSN